MTDRVKRMEIPASDLNRFLAATRAYCTVQFRNRRIQQLLHEAMRVNIGSTWIDELVGAIAERSRGAVLIGCRDGMQTIGVVNFARLICGLACAIGDPFSHWNRGTAVFYNRLTGSGPQDGLRSPYRHDPLHTEIKSPCGSGEDMMILGCARRVACNGGESELLHVDDWEGITELAATRDMGGRCMIRVGDGARVERRILRQVYDQIHLCWSPGFVEPENAEQSDWFRAIRKSLEKTRRTFCRVLSPGEILVFDNRRWLHGRRPLQANPNLDRLLLAAHVDHR